MGGCIRASWSTSSEEATFDGGTDAKGVTADLRTVEDQRPPRDGTADTIRYDQASADLLRTDSRSGECQIFPADNPWNTDISSLPVHALSAAFVANIGLHTGLHTDFDQDLHGVPFIFVPSDEPLVPIHFLDFPTESDPGPYPVPLDAPIEGGPTGTGSRIVIAVDMTHCWLYELFNAVPGPAGWRVSNGARFDLLTNSLRPLGWTSADAAGLPVFPGLIRYDEVQSGVINHALRFSVSNPQRAFISPARHMSGTNPDPNAPPMGLRVRLKASVDISGFSPDNQVILTALKTYGMFVASVGEDWFISGSPHPSWDIQDLEQLNMIAGSDFEAVETGPIFTSY